MVWRDSLCGRRLRLAVNRLSGFNEQGIGTVSYGGNFYTAPSSGYLGEKASTRFAWAATAGASFDINSNAKLDISYRYASLGQSSSAATSNISCGCGTSAQPLQVRELYSNDVRIGIRWMFAPEAPANVAQPLRARF
jgi:opacity protein-like surface antigen